MKKHIVILLFFFSAFYQLSSQNNSWFSWGSNSGVYGNGNTNSSFIPTLNKSLDTFKSLYLGSYHVYGIDKNDELWSWGDNGLKGKLGLNSDKILYDTPQKIDGNNKWKCISIWDYLNAGIQNNGKLYAWGRYMGYPDSISSEDRPIDKVFPILLSHDTDWIDVKVGGLHILALKRDSTLWSMGGNEMGELGIGVRLTTVKKPQLIMSDIKYIETKAQTCFMIDKYNRLWTWGANVYKSKITDGEREYYMDSNYYTIPHLVNSQTGWKEVKVNGGRVLGLKNDGSLWSWGVNYYGQLGTGDFNNRDTPTRIASNRYWKSISIGNDNSFALDSQNFLWSWGRGGAGLGLGFGVKDMNTPQKIESDSGWKNILSGSLFCMALKGDSKMPVLKKLTLNNKNLSISPNPTNSEIVLNLTSAHNNQVFDMNIFDFSGRLLKSEVITNLANYKYDIRGEVGTGIYFIKIASQDLDVNMIQRVIVN